MLIFPPEFAPIVKYPGYVWNMKEKFLYSYKNGCLKKLKITRPSIFTQVMEPHYRVSHRGHRKILLLSELTKITTDYKVHIVPTLTQQLKLELK